MGRFAVAVAAMLLAFSGVANADRTVSSLTTSAVTIYSAKWCSACRGLQAALKDRKIAFESIDVDDNPAAFARARAAAGAGDAIPLTSVARTSGTVWIVGADADAIDRAQRE